MKGQSQGRGQGQVDAILEHLGPLSVYAVVQWAGFAVCMIPIAFQMFAIVFTGKDVPQVCSPVISNTSLDHVTELWPSMTGEFSKNAMNRTSPLYNLSAPSLDGGRGEEPLETVNEGKAQTKGGNNSSSTRNEFPKDSSIMSDFDLVCDKAALVGLTQMVLGAGQFLGVFFLPAFADRVGRKRMHIITHALTAVSGLVVAFSPTYVVLAVSKVFVGMGIMGLRLTSSTVMLELFPARLRSLATAVVGGMLFALTTATIAPVAYVLRFQSWRVLQLVFTSFSLLLILQIVILDEPIRALLARNKQKEALKVIRKAARWNKKDVHQLQERFRSLLQPDTSTHASSASPTKDTPTDDIAVVVKEHGRSTQDDNEQNPQSPQGDIITTEYEQSPQDNIITKKHEQSSQNDTLAIQHDQNLQSSKSNANSLVDGVLKGNASSPVNEVDPAMKLDMENSFFHNAAPSTENKSEDKIDSSVLDLENKPTENADGITVSDFEDSSLRIEESSSSAKSNEHAMDLSATAGDQVSILKESEEVKESRTEESVKGHQGSEVTRRTTVNLLGMLRHRRMRMNLVLACTLWFVTSMVYFGMYLISGSLAGDLYVNFCLNALVEIPSSVIFLFTLDRYGRKWTLGSFQVLCGICLISSGICRVFQGSGFAGVLSTVLFMVGKFGAAASTNVVVMYTGEIFPTVCRNQCMGIAAGTGRLGIMISPFGSTLAQHFPWAPGVVFGGISLLCLGTLFFLPETAGRELPQTVEDLDSLFLKEADPQPAKPL